LTAPSPRISLLLLATLFGAATFGLSWWHWWNYQYGSFDLAFYVQSLWLMLHGVWQVSLLNVPLLGNHAEPIVFLLAPLFAIVPHPMLLVAVQAIALATMPFTARRIALGLGIEARTATILASTTLLIPASGFISIHEFHPEAFAAPLLLLLAEARLARKIALFWVWFVLTAACKENIALMLFGWGIVHAWHDRKQSWNWQWRWNFAPALTALAWVGLYGFWLAPRLNGGLVDYGNLYGHLGNSAGDIVLRFFTEPGRVLSALRTSIVTGNLVWSLLVSFALLPLLKPRWLLIAAPVLLQHLLSIRPSEWVISYHYAAPFVPLFWLAAVEAFASLRLTPIFAWLPAGACLLLQFFIGPFREVPADWQGMNLALWNREWKSHLVEKLEADPSLRVTAGLGYLSHLAKRRELYSLHLVIKGLNTLGNTRYNDSYQPDAVLLDYSDLTTFNLEARYYHPPGQFKDTVLPSSDELLNQFLGRYRWTSESINSATLLHRIGTAAKTEAPATGTPATGANQPLVACAASQSLGKSTFQVGLSWQFIAPRKRIEWLMVILKSDGAQYPITVGMCSPEIASGPVLDQRQILFPPNLPDGKYQGTAIFFDKIEALWQPNENPVLFSVPLGEIICQRP